VSGRGLRWLSGAIGLVIAAAALTSWMALESNEVVVLRTTAPDGSARDTRVWIADEGAHSWLEAATPERPWYLDLLERPRVKMRRGGLMLTFDAVPRPGARGREHIRGLLREKYGWADAWVGLLQDTSHAIEVRLDVVRPARAPSPGAVVQ
jgi:hypothetical protein